MGSSPVAHVYLGSSPVAHVYLGSSPVSHVYLGSSPVAHVCVKHCENVSYAAKKKKIQKTFLYVSCLEQREIMGLS